MQEPNVKINCHSSICIDDNIFVDPFNIKQKKNAKAIFITHSHFDHLDVSSIKNLLDENTQIVCTKDSAEILNKASIVNNINIVTPNTNGKVCGIDYKTFPSYNFGHHHFKEYGFVGYTLTINNVRYTICGDTDATPELKEIKTDVLLIPIGGTFTMDYREAAKLINEIKPKVAVPIHYGSIVGDKEDGFNFSKLVDTDIEVDNLVNMFENDMKL